MAYRNKVYVSMDADNDLHYYFLMKAWKQNDYTSFNFYDAHDINTILDRQWYAVKRQLLENSIEKHTQAKRNILANEYLKELEKLDDIIEQKYGERTLRDVDLLPDT